MTEIEQIKALLDKLLAGQADPSIMKLPLGEIALALQELVVIAERPREEAAPIAAAITQALQGLSFPITVSVNPTPVTVQQPQINVAAPNVTVQAPPLPEAPKGWTLTVTSFDAMNRIRTISFKPE